MASLIHFCLTDGITIPKMSWHQCKLYCMHSCGCQAVNFNLTANICVRLRTTCAKAINHREMAFVLFTEKQADQCYEWIPIESADPRDPSDDNRSLSEDNVRFVARVQKDENDFGAYFFARWRECISSDHEGPIKTSVDGHSCQYLLIKNGCTAYYVEYVLRTPLPANALVAGYTAEGIPIYIVLYKVYSACYILGSNKFIIGFRAHTKMLHFWCYFKSYYVQKLYCSNVLTYCLIWYILALFMS